MNDVIMYPAIFEPIKKGFSVFFPDLPGAVSAGDNFENCMLNAKECLSLHIYAMQEDGEKLPTPSAMKKILKQCETGDLATLVEADPFSVRAKKVDRAIRINITLPKSLLIAIDHQAKKLNINRSAFIQKAALTVL